MEKYLLFVIAFGILVSDNIRLVQCADQCKTHADCTLYWRPYCCGGYSSVGSKDRTCTYVSSCLNRYCSSDSDCGDPSLCCRSNTCVNKGCSGCTGNTDCYSSHVCCKKTFTFNQTVCSDNCINQICNSNDDCAARNECCRSGKCVTIGCRDKCTSNSECNLDQYCCKKKSTFWGGDNCAKSCVGEICRIDDDCGGPNVCCISNTCVDRGCSGCTSNTDCYSSHVCCKKTFPFDQTVCAVNCINQTCNSNDDCGARRECCRSGKCTNNYTACRDKCTSNSECNLDQYCCNHKKSSYWEDNCAKSCVGEICRTDDDCGARNVCCISNTCVDRGCSGCTTNADCSTGQYCCKNRHSFSGGFSVCSAHCVGKSCSTSDDCGGSGETCNSDRKCAVNQNSNTTLSSWLIAVITANLVVFLIAVGLFLAVFRCVKKRRAVNATETVAVPLHDTPRRKAQIQQNQQTNTQFSYRNNETDHSQHDNKNVARPSHYPSHQRFQNGPQATSSQGLHVTQNAGKSPQQANENHGFRGSLPPIYKNHTAQSDEVHRDHNQLRQPVYHILKSPETTKDAQIRNKSGHKIYPQNTAPQDNDYNVIHPPYNPMYQSKR